MKQRKRTRMKGYDYSSDNMYFVTSIVHNRIRCFGEIINDEMQLNEYGKIANDQFIWLNQQYSYVLVHEFVIMPDHIHAVIEINRSFVGNGRDRSGKINNDRSEKINNDRSEKIIVDHSVDEINNDHSVDEISRDRSEIVRNGRDRSSQSFKIKPISELLGAYKSRVSKQIRDLGFREFQWQKSFHDRIIRNESEYDTVVQYIMDNPKNWNRKNSLMES